MPKRKPKRQENKKTVGYLTDIHMPYHDEEALQIAMQEILSCDPQEIIMGGDVPDFYKVSAWKKDPDRMPFIEELHEARRGILGMAKKFKKQKVTYIQGNHEERIQSYLWTKAPDIAGLKELILPKLLRINDVGWDYVDNKKRLMNRLGPYHLGKLNILHGHEIRMGWGAINLAKIYYDRCRTNVLVGHHHRAQEWIVRTLDRKHEGSWLVGFLGELSPEFMPHNDWVHGFAIITVYSDGDFKVENKKIINGKVL
jgi:predicted phosphodiesterase